MGSSFVMRIALFTFLALIATSDALDVSEDAEVGQLQRRMYQDSPITDHSQSMASTSSQSKQPPKANGRPVKYPALYDLVSKASSSSSGHGESIVNKIKFTNRDGVVVAQVENQEAPVFVNMKGVSTSSDDMVIPHFGVSDKGLVYGPKKQSRYSKEKASAECRGVLEQFMQSHRDKSAMKRASRTAEERREQLDYKQIRNRADLEALALIDPDLAKVKRNNQLERNRAYNKTYYEKNRDVERQRRMRRYYQKKLGLDGASSSSSGKVVHDFDLNEPAPIEEDVAGAHLERRTLSEGSSSHFTNTESSSHQGQSGSVTNTSGSEMPKPMSKYMRSMKRREANGTLEAFKQRKSIIQEEYRRRAIERERLMQQQGAPNALPEKFRARKYIVKENERGSSVTVPEVSYHQTRVRRMKEKGTYEEYREKRKKWSAADRLRYKQKVMERNLAVQPEEVQELSSAQCSHIFNSGAPPVPVVHGGEATSVRNFDLNLPATGEEDEEMPLARRTLPESSSSHLSIAESSEMASSKASTSEPRMTKYRKSIANHMERGSLDEFRARVKNQEKIHIEKAIERERLVQERENREGRFHDDFRARKYRVKEDDDSVLVPEVTYHQVRIRKMREKGTLITYKEKRKEYRRKYRLRDAHKKMMENDSVPAPLSDNNHTGQMVMEGVQRSIYDFDLNEPAKEEEEGLYL